MSTGTLDQVKKPSAFGAICRRLYSHRMYQPFRLQRRRRLLVLAMAVIVVAYPLVGLLGNVWAVIALLVPHAAVVLALGAATQGMLDRPIASLDERQREQRLTLFRDPYVTGVTLGLAGGVSIVAIDDIDDALATGILMAVIALLYTLPTMLLAWRLPDDIDDEAELDG